MNDENVDSLLHNAARKGYAECVDKLLGRFKFEQSLCKRKNNRGYTPLHLAAESGHVECVHRLL